MALALKRPAIDRKARRTGRRVYALAVTTQGPTYPPSEVMDAAGHFVVIGRINRAAPGNGCVSPWGAVLVSRKTVVPPFGEQAPYDVVRELDLNGPRDLAMILHTLPVPLPCNNYPMVFAPTQAPDAGRIERPSLPFHRCPAPDQREEDGPRPMDPVTLARWIRAAGELSVSLSPDRRYAYFEFEFAGLLPDALYTVMSLRERDLDPAGPTRPGPLGIPNVFVTDHDGNGRFWARLPDPFPGASAPQRNRIINVILLWMSTRMSYGGAIGWHGLGGDVHAQLKLKQASFQEFETRPA